VGRECTLARHIEETGRKVASSCGFEEIRTPILESTSTFQRSLGDGSDVVMKEMYSFMDKSGKRSLTLRPEGTAGVCRAAMQRKDISPLSMQKLFYHGPMFRYERPQQGRQRQFHQFGVEIIGTGSCHDPIVDVEVITSANFFLKELGILDTGIKLVINSLGDKQSRLRYEEALGEYFHKHSGEMSSESQHRIVEGRFLRVLDSKSKEDAGIIQEAPKLENFLSEESKRRFENVQEMLLALSIDFHTDSKLVRGLDYYSHTIFEYIVTGKEGSQNAILAGGRYDELAKVLGFSEDVSGMGWAAGVERLKIEIDKRGSATAITSPTKKLFIIALLSGRDTSTESHQIHHAALKLMSSLRQLALSNNVDLVVESWTESFSSSGKTSIKKGLHAAERAGAQFAAIVGPTEVKEGGSAATLKNLITGDQKPVLQGTEKIMQFMTS